MKTPTPAAMAQRLAEQNRAAEASRPQEHLVLDLRDLPPPEPLQRSLEAVMGLTAGAKLVVRTRYRPAHLIDQLEARHCAHESKALGDGGWETTIWRRS